mgnify:CR=1 FL=1
MKYFRNTLKWHNVFIDEVLEFKTNKSVEEKAKESREVNSKSYEDYPWTELCEDVMKLKKLQ